MAMFNSYVKLPEGNGNIMKYIDLYNQYHIHIILGDMLGLHHGDIIRYPLDNIT
jgi:hypothetical protein